MKEFLSCKDNKLFKELMLNHKYLDLLIKTENKSINDPVLTEVERIKILKKLTQSALNYLGPPDQTVYQKIAKKKKLIYDGKYDEDSESSTDQKP